MNEIRRIQIIAVAVLCIFGLALTAQAVGNGNLKDQVAVPEKGKTGPKEGIVGPRGNSGLIIDNFPKREKEERDGLPPGTVITSDGFPEIPLEDTFLLHSYPSSNQKLYIDFTGYKKEKAWTLDGDKFTFNDEERKRIQEIWYAVSEDFMPFTIDVTTEEPPSGFHGHRAVVDGAAREGFSWAYRGTWGPPTQWNYYAYIDRGDDSWSWIATSISHEIGHTLDLFDHGSAEDGGYYFGHGEGWNEWGVIMGWDSYSLGIWDAGQFPNPNYPEDSLAIITANPGVTYKPDDHGSTIATATPIDITAPDLIGEGNIEQNTDVDFFSFTMASGGDVTIAINGDIVKTTTASTNLNILATIYDSNGAVLFESDPIDRIWATFDVNLPAGDYYLSVDGVGYDDPGGTPWEGFGYTDYGILGYYSIRHYTGDLTPPTPDPMTWATLPHATSESSIAMTATTASDPDGVEYQFFCVAGPGNDSGWQTSPVYEDTNLQGNTQYSYIVVARDDSVMTNETAPSTTESVTLGGDTTAPTPDPMTWATLPHGTSDSSIAMVATTANDPAGVEYYFDETSGNAGGSDSGWQDSASYTDSGLSAGTEYTYTVTARDKSAAQNFTGGSASASAITGESNIVLSANGGVLDSFTSEYNGNFGAALLANGNLNENGWASEENPSPPQEFVYSFSGGQDATLHRAVIHGGLAEGLHYSKDVEVWTSADGSNFTLAGSSVLLNVALDSTVIDLGGVTASKVKLTVTSGYRADYWELAEFQVFGTLGGGGGDTTPPTPNPASFASLPSADGDTSISMSANVGSDPSGPVLYLFDEISGNPGATDSGWQTSTSYTDTGLTPGTQYTYTVAMMDQEGNFGSASPAASATTTGGGCTPTDMHIANVFCEEVNCGQGKKNGRVTVTIHDDCGNPVANALVDISFTGDFNESFTDVATNSSGEAVVTTSGCVRKPGFTATVTDVTGSLPYDSNDDVTNSCSG
jgi:hypothetical protein